MTKRKKSLKSKHNHSNNRISKLTQRLLKREKFLPFKSFLPQLNQKSMIYLINHNAPMTLKRKHTSRRLWEIRNSEQNYASEPHEMAK